MGSRLTRDNLGRTVCVDDTGYIWIVLPWTVLGFEPPGRAPTPRERMKIPTSSAVSTIVDVPDEDLADAEAIKLARVEQERRPVDLVNVAA
jgi:hypothetical protein